MKKISDYLPFYLGCEAIITDVRNDSPDEHWAAVGNRITIDTSFLHYISEGWISVKPIFRPLVYITEEELDECTLLSADMFKIICDPFSKQRMVVEFECNARVTKYLLLKHFDLFNLIEEGLAIDATKLNQ